MTGEVVEFGEFLALWNTGSCSGSSPPLTLTEYSLDEYPKPGMLTDLARRLLKKKKIEKKKGLSGSSVARPLVDTTSGPFVARPLVNSGSSSARPLVDTTSGPFVARPL